MFSVEDKNLRDRACKEIARWFYDAGIPFNVANYPSFASMIEAIGQYSPGMKPPSMHETRFHYSTKKLKKPKSKWRTTRKNGHKKVA